MLASSLVRATLLRTSALASVTLLSAAPLLAQEHEAASGPVNLLEPKAGLMFWTLVVFVILFVVLSKYAFKPLFESVEARERALEEAIEGAKRDRAEAAELLSQQRALLDAGRADAQKFIADSRAVAEKMRRESIDLAIAGASRVIEQNLDSASNRRIVETFLGSLDAPQGAKS